MVANPQENYRAMYRDAQTVNWNGRLLVTLNGDSHSLAMIPDLAISLEEKVMILKFQDTPYSFPPRFELESTIAAELPYVLRYLTDWEIPEEVKGDNRLGVNSYINAELRAAALSASSTGNLFELIDLWIKRGWPDGEYWEGSATELFALLAADDMLRPSMTRLTPRSLGMRLAQAAQTRNSGIELAHSSTKGNTYRINLVRERERKAVRVKVGL